MAYKIPKTKIIANAGIYYKLNQVILKKGNKYILRNTWTGEEKLITKEDAMKLKKTFKEYHKISKSP